MKIKIIYLFNIFLAINCYSQHSIKDWNLNGEVKSVKETAFNATEKFGELVKGSKTEYKSELIQPSHIRGGSSTYIYDFDTKGNLIKTQLFDKNGSLKYTQQFYFDKQNRLIDDNFNNGEKRITYEYNDLKKVKSMTYTYNTKPKNNEKRIHKFNLNGDMIEISFYYLDGTLRQRGIISYENTPSRKIKTIKQYNSEGLLKNTEVETRTSDKKLIVRYKGNIGDALETRITEIYNKKRLVLEKKSEYFIFSPTEIDLRIYEYDKNGTQLIKEIMDNNSYGNISQYEYNQFMDLIAYISRDRKSNEIKTKYLLKYEYDLKKNWIKKIVYVNGVVPKYVIERKITYY
jgi:hypothetical protein